MAGTVLHPNQFRVNEAWIAFRLNDAPIPTRENGDFNCVALMDAASCFILASMLVSIEIGHLSNVEAQQLLEDGYAHKQEVPGTLFIPNELPADNLALAAQSQKINVVRVPEAELMIFIADAKESFREKFGGRKWQPSWSNN